MKEDVKSSIGVIIIYDEMICTSTHVKRYADEQIKNLSVDDFIIVSNQSITLPHILLPFNKTLPHLSHTTHTLT